MAVTMRVSLAQPTRVCASARRPARAPAAAARPARPAASLLGSVSLPARPAARRAPPPLFAQLGGSGNGPAVPPGGGGGGGGPEGSGSGDDESRRNDKAKLLGIAAAAVAVSAAFALVPAAHAEGEAHHEHRERMTFGEIAEWTLEHALFSSRFLVLLAVVGAVTMGAGMFVKGVTTVRKAWLALLAGKSSDMGIKAIESLDEFLTGCASLVFGMGLYELFISKMHIADPEEDPEAHARAHKGGFNIGHRPQWLALDGLGDLKHRTGAVIIMVMVVNVFEHSKKMAITAPIELVYLGGAALLSAMAVSLMGIEFNEKKKEEEEKH